MESVVGLCCLSAALALMRSATAEYTVGQTADCINYRVQEAEKHTTGQIAPYFSGYKEEENRTSCPPWYTKVVSNGSVSCECSVTFGGLIQCSDPPLLRHCYCMTYGEDGKSLVVGKCVYGCDIVASHPYYQLPHKTSDLNIAICNPFNREGQLCGRCKPGFGLPVYSFQMFCANCRDSDYNWAKYVGAAFLPLTAFFFLVITFRISATSPSLNAFIFICQILTTPVLMRNVATDV